MSRASSTRGSAWRPQARDRARRAAPHAARWPASSSPSSSPVPGSPRWRIVGQRDVATTVPEAAAQPSSCADPTAVRLAVAPAVAPIVAAAAEALSKHPDGPCAAYDIEPAEAYAVAGLAHRRPPRRTAGSPTLPACSTRAEQTSGTTAHGHRALRLDGLVVAPCPPRPPRQLGDEPTLGAPARRAPRPCACPTPTARRSARLALGAAAATLDDARLRAAVAASARAGAATVALDGGRGRRSPPSAPSSPRPR